MITKAFYDAFGIPYPEEESLPKTTSTHDLKQFALAFLKRWAGIVPVDAPFTHEITFRHKESGRTFCITTTINDVTMEKKDETENHQ